MTTKFEVGKEYERIGQDSMTGVRARVVATNNWGAAVIFTSGACAGQYGGYSHLTMRDYWRPAPRTVERWIVMWEHNASWLCSSREAAEREAGTSGIVNGPFLCELP